ncbi:hypothetical protein Tco_0535900 [Tanacetum coccineum]
MHSSMSPTSSLLSFMVCGVGGWLVTLVMIYGWLCSGRLNYNPMNTHSRGLPFACVATTRRIVTFAAVDCAMMSLLVGRNREEAVCILAWKLIKVSAMADIFCIQKERAAALETVVVGNGSGDFMSQGWYILAQRMSIGSYLMQLLKGFDAAANRNNRPGSH